MQGQGLGANADGIVEPIMLERAKAPKASKKGEESGSKKSGAGGMGIGGSKMGRIVNAQAEEKTKTDLLRYGESSRIVVLTNMVGPEDVDESLQGEIGRSEYLHLVSCLFPCRRRMLEARDGRACSRSSSVPNASQSGGCCSHLYSVCWACCRVASGSRAGRSVLWGTDRPSKIL